MNILIDADGCPVVDLTLQIAKRFVVPVIILCDTAHQIEKIVTFFAIWLRFEGE